MAPMKAKATAESSTVVKGKFAKSVSTKVAASKRPAAADDVVDAVDPDVAVDEAPEVTMKKPAAAAAAAAESSTVVKGKFAKVVSSKIAASKRPAAADAEAEAEAEVEAEAVDEEPAVTMKKPAAVATSLKRPAAAIKGGEVAVPKKGKVSEKAVEENALAERTKELKAMLVADLKDLVKSKGLDTGVKQDMIDAVLALEAKAREAAKAQAMKVKEVEAMIKSDFASKSSPDLKELCGSNGLKKAGSKDELVARLVEHAKANGEVEKILNGIACDARRQELSAMEKGDLQTLCHKAGVDPLVKEVMVERLLMTDLKA